MFAYHKFEQRAPKTTVVQKSDLIQYFKTMALYRRVEMQSEDLYRNKFIRGFLHVYTGQVNFSNV